jgi:hypothetical protein
MGRRGIVLNSLVALVAVLLTSAVAAVAVIGGLPSDTSSDLVAAEAAERASVSPSSEIRSLPTTTAVTTRPPVTVRIPIPIPTTPPPPETTVAWDTVPDTMPDTPPAPVVTVAPPPAKSCLPAPVCLERRPAPAVPPSWEVVENGITVTARIEPAAPQVGDTVTIFYTAQGPGDFCCWVHIYGPNGGVLHDSLPDDGSPCPAQAVTSGSVSIVMGMPANYSFALSAKAGHLCQGPPTEQYPAANLSGTFWVNPLP